MKLYIGLINSAGNQVVEGWTLSDHRVYDSPEEALESTRKYPHMRRAVIEISGEFTPVLYEEPKPPVPVVKIRIR